MPVVLSPDAYDLWLDPQVQEVAKIEPLLRPAPDDELVAFPVSLRVNSPSNDDPSCIRPVDGAG
jgi:putative SOS response-associated peptidase YedK